MKADAIKAPKPATDLEDNRWQSGSMQVDDNLN
jgi:hypothetical protein